MSADVDRAPYPHLDVDDDELSDDQLREKYAPVCIGPTWKRTGDGGWLLPERTLGWQVLGWAAEFLSGADGTGRFKATPEQARFILWWYAVDEHGEFIYRTGVLQRLKGWGKDPLAAVLCLVEMVGPSRFGGWDRNGQPVGVPHPAAFVQIAAVNQDQTQNTTTMFALLMTEHFRKTYRVDAGVELIRANGGRSRLKAVTSSPRALEGGRSTFIILNETHHWIVGNKGVQMYETIDGNATKMDGRYLAITNAYLPGEDSVAERMRKAWQDVQDGLASAVGQLYDSLEAPSHTAMTERVLRIVIDMVRGDSFWLKIDAIMKSVLNSSISIQRSRRMWLNQVVAGADALYEEADWDNLRDLHGELKPGDEIVLGFDGGKTDDATALIALRVRDGFVKPLGIWEKPDGPLGDGWQVDREDVDAAVHQAFRVYSVQAFYADVALWESYIDAWSREYGDELGIRAGSLSAIGRDMRGSKKELTLAHEQLVGAIFDGALSHDGDPHLRRHVLNVMRAENDYGVSFRKESRESPRKVDAYAAMFLAFTARRELLERGKKKRKRTGRGYFL
ncbi:terminase [Cellulosimicrobium sp. TH-20]|uniref:terminase n=1 Tax=Cellulosimicrobium sp. TH-20 TaxID=1980001 RepID=UPI0011AA86F8|nr:terminase [Cellulosimicrobium sp. TH-20]